MNAPYICLRCLRQLSQFKCPRRSSGFVSSGQSLSRDDNGRTMPREVPLTNGELPTIPWPNLDKRSKFAQVYQEQRKAKSSDKVLETLFASSRENEQASKMSRYPQIPKGPPPISRAIDPSTKHCLKDLHHKLQRGTIEKATEGWKYQPWREAEEILEPSQRPYNPPNSTNGVDAALMRQPDWGEKALRTNIAMIEGASKRSDTKSVLTLWHQFQAHLEADKSMDKADSIDQLYVRFIRAFGVLRRNEHAIEVWNHRIKSGHPPSQQHWSAMLNSCVRAKDVKSLREIWTNMLRAGVLPDIHTWTTYIHGLIDGNEWEEGLNALEHLGRIWKSAPPLDSPHNAAERMTGITPTSQHQSTEELKDDTVLLPTAAPINAALSAIIHINKPALLPRVIAWAKSHDVPLSTSTFNILLQPLVRRGSQASIEAHFREMAEANCTPDVFTFGIILKGLVSNTKSSFHALPPEAQESTLTSILADMERHGIEPNALTYSTILDGLLTPRTKEPSHGFEPNVPAASTILAHMAARNVYPSPHIYTILIKYYFTCRPAPDLPAVSSLWSSIRHSGQTRKLDPIFFDRLIEGYADNDELELALNFLRMLPDQGKSPGWYALNRLLKALVRAGEWSLIQELVEDIERERGLLRHGRGRGLEIYRTEFWELVDVLRQRGHVGRADEKDELY